MRLFKHLFHRVFPFLPIPAFLPYGGRVFTWDDYNGDTVFSGDDLEEAHRFVQQFLQPGMTVVDVGAHQGFYTILSSKMVGCSGMVFAFEPSPRERQRLRLNLKLNHCSNVVVDARAVADYQGGGTLYVVSQFNTGCNSMKPPNVREDCDSMKVDVTSLDSFIESRHVGPVHLVKIDAEGAELNILRGARSLMSRRPRPIVVCEAMDVRTRPWGYHSQEILDHLSTMNYAWFRASGTGALEPLCLSNPQGTFVAVPVELISKNSAGHGGLITSGIGEK